MISWAGKPEGGVWTTAGRGDLSGGWCVSVPACGEWILGCLIPHGVPKVERKPGRIKDKRLGRRRGGVRQQRDGWKEERRGELYPGLGWMMRSRPRLGTGEAPRRRQMGTGGRAQWATARTGNGQASGAGGGRQNGRSVGEHERQEHVGSRSWMGSWKARTTRPVAAAAVAQDRRKKRADEQGSWAALSVQLHQSRTVPRSLG